jgi:hypothetical protein
VKRVWILLAATAIGKQVRIPIAIDLATNETPVDQTCLFSTIHESSCGGY